MNIHATSEEEYCVNCRNKKRYGGLIIDGTYNYIVYLCLECLEELVISVKYIKGINDRKGINNT